MSASERTSLGGLHRSGASELWTAQLAVVWQFEGFTLCLEDVPGSVSSGDLR